MRRVAAVVALSAAALAAAGCGGQDGGSPEPAPAGTGYFVGGAAGVSAAVDLRARGREVGEIRRSVGPSRAVAVGALLNGGATSIRLPRFRAVLDDESTIPLAPVTPPEARGAPPGPAPKRLAARGARTLYLVFPAGAPADRTVAIRMAPHGEAVATLRPRRR